jgi:hypothetical protein
MVYKYLPEGFQERRIKFVFGAPPPVASDALVERQMSRKFRTIYKHTTEPHW